MSSLANNNKDKVKKIDVRNEENKDNESPADRNNARIRSSSIDSRNAELGRDHSESDDDDSSSSSVVSYQGTSSNMEESSYYSRSQSNSSDDQSED